MIHSINIQNFAKIIFIVAFSFFSSNVQGIGNDTLISAGDKWKYFDKESSPKNDWKNISFDDSSWPEGKAELGYGDGDEKTVIHFGPEPMKKYITAYFRKNFNVDQLQNFKALQLNLKRDDGAVVYINGAEVYRSNMPEGIITYSTLASSAISGGSESSFISTSINLLFLKEGENVIAVEIHQDAPESSDISFDLSLIAHTNIEVVRGPYLQTATPSSMIIRWRTSVRQNSKVLFGKSTNYSDSVSDTLNLSDHIVKLSKLEPSTKYFYTINSADNANSGDLTKYFITPPMANQAIPVRIWAMGDFGTGNFHQAEVRDAYYSYTGNKYTNLLLWLGDNAYPTGTDEQYSTNVFAQYPKILANSVVYSTCGNHDLFYSNTVNQTGPYFDIFSFPVNGEAGGVPSFTEAYYSFNYSNIHFICLESNIDSFKTKVDDMISWLKDDLGADKMKWTIVYFHCPPYSKGYHDSDIYKDMIYMRQNIVPVLEEYNVDLVLCGHDHDYERTGLLHGHYGNAKTFQTSMVIDKGQGSNPVTYTKKLTDNKGTMYMVVGCTGELEPIQKDWPHPAMAKTFDKTYGSLVIDINGNTLEGKFITDNKKIGDHFVIIKKGEVQ